MTLLVLGSSSSGNAYLLRSSTGEMLLIECGIKRSLLLDALGYDLLNLSGCLLSHEHGDHSREAKWVIDRSIPLYCSRGTAEAIKLGNSHLIRPLVSKTPVKIGSFSVLPFDVKHDAVEPLGFLIDHPEMGRLLFVTDSYLLKYKFSGVSHWLIECNYNQEILQSRMDSGAVHPAQYKRTLKSHMGYDACLKTLRANDLSETMSVVLIHLSDGNSNADKCREGIAKATGVPTYVASPKLHLTIDKTPF